MLTKLYPGADGPHWNVVDFLQVVFHVTLGHSVMETREGAIQASEKLGVREE